MSQSDHGGPYSPFKIVHHANKIALIQHGIQPKGPAQVQIIISDFCNQDCHFCSYRVSGSQSNVLFKDGDNNNPQRRIPYEKVIEILDDCVEMGVGAIQLTGGGEPTAHPRFEDIVRAIIGHGLQLALVTNGVALREPRFTLLNDAAWVRVSVDAGKSETYGKFATSIPSSTRRSGVTSGHLSSTRGTRAKALSSASASS